MENEIKVSVEQKIKKLQRKIENLEGDLLQLHLEKLRAECDFNVGDTVYVYEYRDAKLGGFWHPVTIKSFFVHPSDLEALGFAFKPNDKRGTNLMRWRQAYFKHGKISKDDPTATE